MPIVIAKVGSQITTLLCDEQVYNDLPVKKQVKVEIVGLYIVGIKGPKLNTGQAKKQGWSGCWDKQIEDLNKSLRTNLNH